MLAERAKKWPEQWKQQGLEEGRQEGRQEGLQEGRQEGLQEGRLETARNLIRDTPLADDVIAKAADLDIARVRELRAELKH